MRITKQRPQTCPAPHSRRKHAVLKDNCHTPDQVTDSSKSKDAASITHPAVSLDVFLKQPIEQKTPTATAAVAASAVKCLATLKLSATSSLAQARTRPHTSAGLGSKKHAGTLDRTQSRAALLRRAPSSQSQQLTDDSMFGDCGSTNLPDQPVREDVFGRPLTRVSL